MTPYYQDQWTTIFLGDCREILPTLGPVDLVLTDPPYGVTQNSWDNLAITKECFDLISTPLVFTCQNPASAELICRYRARFKWSDVWEKTQAVGFLNCKIMPLRQHEDILVFADAKIPYYPQIQKRIVDNIRPHGDTAASPNYGSFKNERVRTIGVDESYPRSILRFPNAQLGLHPNEKPFALYAYLVKTYSASGQLILDPFMGSGTTLVAAHRMGRRSIGIENTREYCDIAIERLRQEVLDFTEPLPESQPVTGSLFDDAPLFNAVNE